MLRLPKLISKSSLAWTLAIGLGSGAAAFGALCEESFHLQEAKQYLFKTQDVNNLGEPTITTLKTDLSDMKILFDSSNYQIMVGFDGACGTFTQKEVRFKARKKGEVGLKDAKVNDIYLRMYDSNTVLNGKPYAYWFGFSLRPDTLVYAVGMPKGDNAKFSTWYAIGLLADSTKDVNSGLWSTSFSYQMNMSGPSDSLTLATNTLKGWKNEVFNDNRKGGLQLQMIQITYDTKPTGTRPFIAKRQAAQPMMALQKGENVRISLREDLESVGSIELCDMFGRKIARLHPTGGDYLWNGKTLAGHAALGGVYFAQSQNRVLGKFFYNR
jgi:hypothetical protein